MSIGRHLRLTLYDAGALTRSLAAVLAVVLVSAWLSSPAAAVSAGAAAIVAGASALQDSPRNRFPTVVLVSLEMALAVLLGSLTEGHSGAFVAVTALWCIAAGLQWAISANAGLVAAAGAALILTTVPAAHTAGSVSATAALALGGGLSQAVLIGLWPQRRWRAQRNALTRAYLSLAADADRIVVDPDTRVDIEPLIRLREAFTVSEALAKRRPPIYRGWYSLPERIAESLTSLTPHTGDDAVVRVLRSASELLVMVAHARRRSRSELGYATGQLDGAAGAVHGAAREASMRLSTQLREAVELRFGQFEPERVAQLGRSGVPDALTASAALVRGQLTTSSPIVRHTARLTTATVVGVLLWRYGGVPHGVWMPLTVLMVLRPETAHTYTRCVARIGGTAAGVAGAALLASLTEPSALVSALLAVGFLALGYVTAEYSYLGVNTAIAGALVFLIDTGSPGTADAIGDQLLAVITGGGLAVAVHVLVPDNALVRLRQRAGELLKTEIDYAATVVKAFVHDLDHPKEQLESAWGRAVSARAAFEATAGATGTESKPLRRWMRSYRAALNSVTTSCATLEEHLPSHPPAELNREFIAAVDDYVKALVGDPATPAAPWSVDTDALLAASANVRDAAASLTDANVAERLLVGEIATITGVVTEIAARDIGLSSLGPTSAG
ncbi:FUSC family protein [Mycobacterium sp. MBM]|nr:FUSC family protein [Mycobacterium sp. MBM]